MKTRVITLAVTLLLVPLCAWGSPQDEIGPYDPAEAAKDGRLIAEIADDINRPEKDLIIRAVMTLKSGEEVMDTRQVMLKEWTAEGGLSRALFRFMDSLKRGVTFLTIETDGPDNDQYLYLPSLGRARKIATQDHQNDFEDTDFTNEDLGGRKVDDYLYQRRDDETVGGRTCYKIMARAKDRDARFPKHTTWLDRETFVPVQIKAYGRDNQLERVIVAGKIQKVGNIHIPFKTVAKNMKRNHLTILDVSRAEANVGLDPLDFRKENMGETWNETF